MNIIINEANRKTNISCSTICLVCKNINKTSGGFKWEYKNIQ